MKSLEIHIVIESVGIEPELGATTPNPPPEGAIDIQKGTIA